MNPGHLFWQFWSLPRVTLDAEVLILRILFPFPHKCFTLHWDKICRVIIRNKLIKGRDRPNFLSLYLYKHKHCSWIHANNSNFRVIDIFCFYFRIHLCVLWGFSHTPYFTIYEDINDEGCKFLPLPSIHGNWAVRVLSMPPSVKNPFIWSFPRNPTLPPFFRANVHGVVITCLNLI